MTPQQFHDTYRAVADKVSAGTGIDPIVLLAQWSNETAWGTVVVGNNLGNIRCSPSTFCQYATLDDFAQACIATFTSPSLQWAYGAVLAAVGPAAQLAAIVASPWSSGHYGGSLQSFYAPLEALPEVLDPTDPIVIELRRDIDALTKAAFFGTGTPNTDPTASTTSWGAIQGYAALYEARIKALVLAAMPAGSGGTEPAEPAEPVEPAPVVDLSGVMAALSVTNAKLDAIASKLAKDLA